ATPPGAMRYSLPVRRSTRRAAIPATSPTACRGRCAASGRRWTTPSPAGAASTPWAPSCPRRAPSAGRSTCPTASPRRTAAVPSAGALEALELSLAVLSPGWWPGALYHYGRSGHYLSRLAPIDRAALAPLVPSFELVRGGSIVWVIVGDGARVQPKYGERGL